jgi:uncharacterized protein
MSTPKGHSRQRAVGIDATRAVALLGVITMNFHGYLNFSNFGGLGNEPDLVNRVFDPWIGVLSTRFAATFVTVAGVSIMLLTGRSRASGERERISDDRWRLRRRGLVLLAGGFVLDWIWPGTILFFYGAYFIVASFLFTLRRRWLILIGVLSALSAQAIQLWAVQQEFDGHDPYWLFASSAGADRSPRSLVFDIWINGTHPLLPWLAFLCLGMVLGKSLEAWTTWRWKLVAAGIVLVGGGYGLSTALQAAAGSAPETLNDRRLNALSQTDPFSRAFLYVLVTIGSSLVAVMVISWLGDRFANTGPVRMLASAGQMTLSIYVLHVLTFNLLVNWLGWIQPTGLDTALLFAAAFWLLAVIIAAGWHRFIGQGPLERAYRKMG